MNYGSKPKRSKSRSFKLNRLFIKEDSVCEKCGTKEIKLTVDHIVPCSILSDLGITDFYEDTDNFQILCIDCNTSKRAHLDFSEPRTKQLLLKYLNLIK